MHNHHSKAFLDESADYSTTSPTVDAVQRSQAVEALVEIVYQQLRPRITLQSVRAHDPIEVRDIPTPWQLLGTGNYAAVFLPTLSMPTW